jgi:hypothetical protein
MIKNAFRTVSLLFALMASSAIVLHAAHLEASHNTTVAQHQCEICHSPATIVVASGLCITPALLVSDCDLAFISEVAFDSDFASPAPRGPPSLI